MTITIGLMPSTAAAAVAPAPLSTPPITPARMLTDTWGAYLPAVFTPPGPQPLSLGVDFGDLDMQSEVVAQDFPVAAAMGPSWIRLQLRWDLIEPTKGQFDWSVFDPAYQQAQALGLHVLAVVQASPSWAAAQACGPISDTVAFTGFVQAALARYGANVDAWEFMNEPDGLAPYPTSPDIGCWAPYPDKYAEQLALFYTTVKAVQPRALVFLGGLAYDNWRYFDRQFLTNTLQSGAAPFFDALSYHYYPINPAEFPTVATKAREIEGTLARFHAWNKRLWVTETAMWTNNSGHLTGSLEAQKTFIVAEQTRAFCAGVDNLFWFGIREEDPLPPLHRWLINLQHQPAQGYDTYRYFAEQIRGTACLGAYAAAPANVEAYRLQANDRTVYILWANSSTANVSLPAARAATVATRDGDNVHTVEPQNGSVTVAVTSLPLFVTVPR